MKLVVNKKSTVNRDNLTQLIKLLDVTKDGIITIRAFVKFLLNFPEKYDNKTIIPSLIALKEPFRDSFFQKGIQEGQRYSFDDFYLKLKNII